MTFQTNESLDSYTRRLPTTKKLHKESFRVNKLHKYWDMLWHVVIIKREGLVLIFACMSEYIRSMWSGLSDV